MNDVKTLWKRIRSWYKANAPSNTFFLGDGAPDDDIKSLESELGLPLPRDLKSSYLLYNGGNESSIFPYGYYLLSLTEIAREWRIWTQGLRAGSFMEMRASPEGPIKTDWWNAKWVPITGNGGGDHDCIDMDPHKGGRVGQIIEFSHETGPRRVSASSFTDWLREFGDALEAGRYHYDEDSLSLLPNDEE